MCTVSWIFQADGYELFCNRDETRARARALPPRRHERGSSAPSGGIGGGSSAYLAPEDGDAGGTWIAVNELGLALCLLNRFPDPGGGPYPSRGLLVRELAGRAGAEEVAAELARRAGAGALRYRPFRLLTLAPGVAPAVAVWDGRRLESGAQAATPPLSSSSFDPEGIGEVRRRLWAETLPASPSSAQLLAFHRSHLPSRGPLSPCTHRDDARTVSLTWVRVRRAAVEMSYADGPPCRAELSRPLTLMRQVSRNPALRHAAPVA
jgi:hypothetical protein